MLAKPNAHLAEKVRASFAELAVKDSLELVRASRARGRISAELADELEAALTGTSASCVRSEFFFAYFAAVDAYHASESDLPAALRALAGCLLVEVVSNNLTVDRLPVSLPDEGLRLLSASSEAAPVAGPHDGTAGSDFFAAKAADIAEAVAESWLYRSANLRMRGRTAPIMNELQKYTDQTLSISKLDPALTIPDRMPSDLLAKFERAVELMVEVSPEQAAEVNLLTEYVVPLKGNHFVGGSDITLFGASFLCLDADWSALCFADHMIHEASHQLLHARQEDEPLLLNRDELNDKSPIRADPRPLYGSFHATFVFLRLALFMSAVLESGREDLREEATLRLHRHLVGLLQGLEIIRDAGVLTPAGQAEFDGWVDGARELVSRYGAPQADIYTRLNWDYDVANPALPAIAL